MCEYKYMEEKLQIIFIWIRHLRFEILNNICVRGYDKVINNIINPIEALERKKDYNKIIELCKEGRDLIKILTGDHFHIWLFFKLSELIKQNLKI